MVLADFGITNRGHMRQEIEIGLITLNGNKFIGTITPQEAKFSIFRDSLGFPDFSNLDGVRFAFQWFLPVEHRSYNEFFKLAFKLARFITYHHNPSTL